MVQSGSSVRQGLGYSASLAGLCGVLVCGRMCSRVEHCSVGRQRSRLLLAEQRRRRQLRRIAREAAQVRSDR